MSDGEVRMRRVKAVAATVMVLGGLIIVIITAAVVGGEIGRAFLGVR